MTQEVFDSKLEYIKQKMIMDCVVALNDAYDEWEGIFHDMKMASANNESLAKYQLKRVLGLGESSLIITEQYPYGSYVYTDHLLWPWN